jgi:AcrR family transcriptional regulator
MRVTLETRVATRQRILHVAHQLFAAQGFDATTTREIARAAGLASGTLFNYFPSKEAVVACLAAESLEKSYGDFERARDPSASFEEELFALVAAGLRRLKPLRHYLPVALDFPLSPLATPAGDGQWLRVSHLEKVSQLGCRQGFDELSAVALQMYWSLYTGLLFFWAEDASPRQEDTLALLDHSVEMFVGWLDRKAGDATVKPEITTR